MKKEELFNAVTDIEPRLIEEAGEYTFKKKRNKFPFIVSVAAALIIVAAAGIISLNENFSLFPSSAENLQMHDTVENHEEQKENTETNGENIINTTNSNEEIFSEKTETSSSMSGVIPELLAKAVYPEMASHPLADVLPGERYEYDSDFDEKYEKWYEDIRQLRTIEVATEGINSFSFSLMEKLLCIEDDENKAVSPLNIYMALAVLCETCDGNSRQQILDALGADSVEELRETANGIWRRNFYDDSVTKSIIANSLWLNDGVKYKKDTVMTIAEKYLTSVYSGKMGSAAYDDMLNLWIKEQTGGLLEPNLKMTEETVLSIVSTLLFNAKWNEEFNKENTGQGIFTSPDGEKTVDFMKKKTSMYYFWGENFSAVYLDFDLNGRMWFILPDEGIDADSILADKEVQNLILKDSSEFYEYEKSTHIIVDMAVPKFDIESNKCIGDAIMELGITDVFDSSEADFSPLAEDAQGIFLSEAQHGVRVKIDEEGVAAAAYTMLQEAGAAKPPEEVVEFILDRPFAFAVTYDDETVLFAGVVNKP